MMASGNKEDCKVKFNKDYLIVKKKPSAEKLGVKVYSYMACPITESFDMMNDRLTHTVAFRKKDIGRSLSQEVILGILGALGMRHDGTMVMEQTGSGNVIYFMQAVDAEAA